MSDPNGRSERSTVATAGPRLARVRRSALPAATTAEGLPPRRQWARVAAGAALALLGGWVFASLYVSAGERTEVLAVAEDVEQYGVIERDDLRTVRVSADPGVDTIDADEADSLVGRHAATGLRAGSLLAPSQVLPANARIVGDGESVVGAELSPGDVPGAALGGGIDVLVVLRPPDIAAEAEVEQVPGWLRDFGPADPNDGRRHVSLVVPRERAAEVAAAASDERVAIVALEG